MPDASSASTALSVLAVAALLAWAAFMATSAGAQEDLYNCEEDFTYQEDAQAVYDQDPSDPHGFDGPPGEGFDGEQACEELPRRGDGAPANETTRRTGDETTAERTVVRAGATIINFPRKGLPPTGGSPSALLLADGPLAGGACLLALAVLRRLRKTPRRGG